MSRLSEFIALFRSNIKENSFYTASKYIDMNKFVCNHRHYDWN